LCDFSYVVVSSIRLLEILLVQFCLISSVSKVATQVLGCLGFPHAFLPVLPAGVTSMGDFGGDAPAAVVSITFPAQVKLLPRVSRDPQVMERGHNVAHAKVSVDVYQPRPTDGRACRSASDCPASPKEGTTFDGWIHLQH